MTLKCCTLLYNSLRTFSAHQKSIKVIYNCAMTPVINVSDEAVINAVKLLSQGEIIALPTDTVYGLAVDSLNSDAISRLYEVKGRTLKNPIAICVGSVDDIKIWGKVDNVPRSLLEQLLPGPVTVLLERTDNLNPNLNPGIKKVGIRIPDSEFVCKVASSLGSALALTSANASNELSTLSPTEFSYMWKDLGTVFSGGKLGEGEVSRAGSTIIDLTVPGRFSIKRKGSALESTLKILHKNTATKMKAFFRRLELQNTRRENMVKESLTSQLMASIKEVQLEHAHLQDKEQAQNNEATNFLCTVLEAIFIHGLRETLADRVSIAIADPDQRPEPEFWSPLMVFSHRDIIKQIIRMSQITTDVGRCRAWIRIALNDCLLLSYLEAISQQNNALNPYYKKTAYLRDIELLILAKNSLEGLSSVPFALPTNSSILNVWTNTPLLLAGIWTAPMKSCPIFTGTDVAKTLSIGEVPPSNDDTQSHLSLASYQESLSGASSILRDEDEALKIILGTPIQGSPFQSDSYLDQIGQFTPPNSSALPTSLDKSSPTVREEENTQHPADINDPSKSMPSVSTNENREDTKDDSEGIRKTQDGDKSVDVTKNKDSNNQSYQSLLKSYNPSTNSYYKTPDLKDILQRFESFPPKSPDSSESDDGISKMDFEIISETSFSINAPEFKNMVDHLSRIMQEPGLDVQDYACCNCKQPIGISFIKARLCALTGVYYCSDCFMSVEWIIPSRIIHNWDFSRHEVCGKAALFLGEIQHHPLLDIRKINPKLYLAIEEMSVLQKLRLKLNLLRGYLMTCREPIMKKLQKQVWPREYLYEHVHLYSVADLVEIPNGILAEFLQNLITFSQEHVQSCCLCSQKGFICEICKDPKVIYPFDLDTSYRCLLCKSVFHTSCKMKVEVCPKCKRIKERQANLDCEDIM